MNYATHALKKDSTRVEPICILKESISNSYENKIIDNRFRIMFLEEGSGSVSVNNQQILWIAPCVICVSEKDSLEFAQNIQQKTLTLETIYFHPQFINKGLNFDTIRKKGMDAPPEVIENRLILTPFFYDSSKKVLNHISPESSIRIRNLINSAKEELVQQNSGWWPCRTRYFLTELLFFLAHLLQTSQSTEIHAQQSFPVSENFKPIVDYLMGSYHTKISLDALARKFGTNRTSLNQQFKKETGMTVIAYIIDLRLRIASTMLSDTDLPIAEIAERTGCGDISYFERIFKKKYTESPTSYRNQRRIK